MVQWHSTWTSSDRELTADFEASSPSDTGLSVVGGQRSAASSSINKQFAFLSDPNSRSIGPSQLQIKLVRAQSSYETWDVYLLRLVAVRSQDICAYAKYIMTMMAPNRTHRPRTSLYYKIGFIHDSKRRDRVSHPYHYQRCRLTGPATKHKTRTTMKGYH